MYIYSLKSTKPTLRATVIDTRSCHDLTQMCTACTRMIVLPRSWFGSRKDYPKYPVCVPLPSSTGGSRRLLYICLPALAHAARRRTVAGEQTPVSTDSSPAVVLGPGSGKQQCSVQLGAMVRSQHANTSCQEWHDLEYNPPAKYQKQKGDVTGKILLAIAWGEGGVRNSSSFDSAAPLKPFGHEKTRPDSDFDSPRSHTCTHTL